jgi:hypothetical protein
MRTTLLTAFFAGLLALVPLSASAMDSALEIEQVSTYVTASLAAGTSPEDIIRALDDYHGMTLSEATVFAMVAAGQANHEAFATAGIRQATSLEEAREVADAVRVVDDSYHVATAADRAVNKFIAQPKVYKDNYTNVGGAGVSPAS